MWTPVGYRPIRTLGSGGSGTVLLCECEETGESFSLKVVPAGDSADTLDREGKILAGLSHPGLPDVRMYGQDEDRAFYA
jgi:serine/threonine protein kinase